MQNQAEFAHFLHQQLDAVTEAEPVLANQDSGLTRLNFTDLIKKISTQSSSTTSSRLADEFDWHGPLKNLFADPTVTEIIINSFDEVFFEQHGTLQASAISFLSERTYLYFVNQFLLLSQINIDKARPQVCATWDQFRVHVSRPEVTGRSFQLCFRRLNSHSNDRNIGDVLSAVPQIEQALLSSIAQKENILILGTTGSGKTSLANKILKRYPNNHRFLILEDTSELNPPNTASSKLLSRPAGLEQLPEINLCDLIHQSLRMRPDSIVIGEIRSTEAKDYLLSLSTGHSGSVATIHADSAEQALFRLEMLVQMGAPQWSLQTIRRLISLSLQKLIMVERTHTGERRVTGVYKLSSLESDGFRIDTVAELSA